MTIQPHEQPTFQDIVRVVLRHSKKLVLFVVAMSALIVAVLLILPHQYASEAKLLVLVGRESVSLDPVVSTGKTLNIDASRVTEITTLKELLTSRSILSKVVDEIGPEKILELPGEPGVYDHALKYLDDVKSYIKDALRQSTGESEGEGAVFVASREEEAIESLSDCVSVNSAENSSLIAVTVTARSPARAQQLAAAVVDVYTREHSKLHATSGSDDFFRTQKEHVAAQLAERRVLLSDLKAELGVGSLEAEFKRLEDEKAAVAVLKDTLARDLAGALAKSVILQQAVDSAQEVVLTERAEGISNPATAGIRQQLYELETAEGKAASLYSPDHPNLKSIRTQLAQMRERYEAEQAKVTETRFGRNLSREALDLEYAQLQARISELQAQTKLADLQWEKAIDQLEDLNHASARLEQLSQDVAFLARSYDVYSDSLEQTRIGNSLTQQKISNINVAQPASYVSEPAGASKALMAVGGLFASILCALPLAFLFEYCDGRVRSAAEVEMLTDLPVLAALPRKSKPIRIPPPARRPQNVG